MKEILSALLAGAAELLNEPLRSGMLALSGFVRNLDLPDGDDRWDRVAEMLQEAMRDMAAAKDLDEDARFQARIAAERRMHLQLRELGLIERG